MSYPEFDNRFMSRLKAGPTEAQTMELSYRKPSAADMQRGYLPTPNRKSEAKKRWWAEKKAAEAQSEPQA